MGQITEKFISGIGYSLAIIQITTDFESVKSFMMFISGMVLFGLQIRKHIVEIIEKRRNKE